MEKLRPKMGNPWAIIFGFSLFVLILCIPNVSKNSYHEIGADKLSAKHKGVMMGVVQLMD